MTNESFRCSSRHKLVCVVNSVIAAIIAWALDVGDDGTEVLRLLLDLLRQLPSLVFVCCRPMITDRGCCRDVVAW